MYIYIPGSEQINLKHLIMHGFQRQEVVVICEGVIGY